jgi:hypothetical protein
MQRVRHTVLLSLLALLCACSSSADLKQAEQAIERFHQQLDAGQSADIYEAASDDLKKVALYDDFVTFLDAVHRRFGNTKSSSRKGWNVNDTSSGAFITLSYETTFAEGKASEQFVYRLSTTDALLAGYHVGPEATHAQLFSRAFGEELRGHH